MTQKQNMSRTMVKANITLSTTESQRLFRRIFERTDTALMWLETIFNKVRNVDQFGTVFNNLETEILECRKGIEQQIAQIRELAEQQGMVDVVAEHKFAVEMPVEIRHPASVKVMQLFVNYDELMKEVNAMWIMGLLNREQKQDAAARARGRISEICLNIMRTNAAAQALYKRAKTEGRAIVNLADADEEAIDKAVESIEGDDDEQEKKIA